MDGHGPVTIQLSILSPLKKFDRFNFDYLVLNLVLNLVKTVKISPYQILLYTGITNNMSTKHFILNINPSRKC